MGNPMIGIAEIFDIHHKTTKHGNQKVVDAAYVFFAIFVETLAGDARACV